MRENSKGTMNIINEALIEIQHLKGVAEKFSWLLGEELTQKNN